VESCEPYHSPPATEPPSAARRMRDKHGLLAVILNEDWRRSVISAANCGRSQC
jgi:hypothetical protein